MATYGVLLTDEGIKELGQAISPYLLNGSIGKYMYCSHAVQNGNFFDLTFNPSESLPTLKEGIIISIPVNFVKFIATSEEKSQFIGFNI